MEQKTKGDKEGRRRKAEERWGNSHESGGGICSREKRAPANSLDPDFEWAGPDTRTLVQAGDSVCAMKHLEKFVNESGKIGYALLWLLGVPLPILLIIYLVRGN